jgi:hypothetical protein
MVMRDQAEVNWRELRQIHSGVRDACDGHLCAMREVS